MVGSFFFAGDMSLFNNKIFVVQLIFNQSLREKEREDSDDRRMEHIRI